jgi:hypothetical protein
VNIEGTEGDYSQIADTQLDKLEQDADTDLYNAVARH